jgi:hypothetical protein
MPSASSSEPRLWFSDLILRSRESGVSKEDPVLSGDVPSFGTLRSSG